MDGTGGPLDFHLISGMVRRFTACSFFHSCFDDTTTVMEPSDQLVEIFFTRQERTRHWAWLEPLLFISTCSTLRWILVGEKDREGGRKRERQELTKFDMAPKGFAAIPAFSAFSSASASSFHISGETKEGWVWVTSGREGLCDNLGCGSEWICLFWMGLCCAVGDFVYGGRTTGTMFTLCDVFIYPQTP